MFVLHCSSVNSLKNAFRINVMVGICFFKKHGPFGFVQTQHFKEIYRELYAMHRDFCNTNMLFWTFMFLLYAHDVSSEKPASYFNFIFAQQLICDSLFSTILCTVILYNIFLYRSFHKIFMPLILQRYCK